MTNQSHATRLAGIAKMRIGSPSAPLAQAAMQLADPERVSSAPGIVGLFERDAATIRSDRDLSDEGKTARLRNLAQSRLLGGLAATARDLTRLEREHAAKKADALRSAAPPADAATTLVDLALAAQVKAEPATAFTLERSSQRLREALARMPLELSGLSAEAHGRVLASLIPGDTAASLGEEAAALESARKVTQRSIDELQRDARADADALIRAFGTDWQLPGVIDSLAQRLHAGQQAQDGPGEAAAA